eukprot:scaffold251379_cov38-Attheya_sp.AAC.1
MTAAGRRRVLALSALVVLAGQYAEAFSPASFAARTGATASTTMTPSFLSSTALSSTVNSDVSVVYDSAARLAYQGWCAKYDKPQEESRYAVFKANYEAITVANVSAVKKARDESGDWMAKAKQTLDLNEFADFTADEYAAAQSSPAAAAAAAVEEAVEAPLTTGDVLGKALEAAEAQSEASSALVDAAEALAEEEEKLAAQLGLESVEELEAALDAVEGIADDGAELVPDNLSREAR